MSDEDLANEMSQTMEMLIERALQADDQTIANLKCNTLPLILASKVRCQGNFTFKETIQRNSSLLSNNVWCLSSILSLRP